MNNITVTKDKVYIQITGMDKIWSFKGVLTIPRECIKKIYKHDGKLKPPFWRCPGTWIPGIITSGTYYGKGRKEFWNTHFRREAIVFDLRNTEYTRVVVDVKYPDKFLSELQSDADQFKH